MNVIVDQIYHDDGPEVMRKIPSESIDLVLADPPYGDNYQSNWCINGPRFDKMVNDSALHLDWMGEAFRITKPSGSLICFCKWDSQDVIKETISSHGYRVKSQVIWDRVGHGMGDLKRQFAPRHDIMWFAIKSNKFNFRKEGGRPPTVLSYPRPPTRSMIHPTQKPVALYERLLLSLTDAGDTVFDPFMGSGTTALACIHTKRHFIGAEIYEPYFNLAQSRIDAEEMNL